MPDHGSRRRLLIALAGGLLLTGSLLLAGCGLGANRSPRPGVKAKTAPLPPVPACYGWRLTEPGYQSIAQRFPSPPGFRRAALTTGSWADWLRGLPMKADGSPVVTYRGRTALGGSSPVLAGVVDLDVREHQECADVILRLRAEYLLWAKRGGEIAFRPGGGGKLAWSEWKNGVRPSARGNRLRYSRTADRDSSRASFERFLDAVFMWCGTYTLAGEGRSVSAADIRVGDFLVHGGSPGHAVLVVDLARDDSGRTKALLLEGYMPAQSAYVMAPDRDSVWFDLDPGRPVDTPRYGPFQWSELRRFRGARADS